MKIDKDLKYCEKQIELQNDKVRSSLNRLKNAQHSHDMSKYAVELLKKEEQEFKQKLDVATEDYDDQIRELHRLQKHYNRLHQQKNMILNQHKSVA